MAIKYDEYGIPYDDGVYEYGQEFTQEQIPQQDVIVEGSGGGDEYNYQQDIPQENPAVILDDSFQPPAPSPLDELTAIPEDPYANEPTEFQSELLTDPYSYDIPEDTYDIVNKPDVLNGSGAAAGELTGFSKIYEAMTPAEKSAYDNEWERPIYITGSNVRVDEPDARIKVLEEFRLKDQMNFAEKAAYDQAILAREMGGSDTRVPRDDGNLLAVAEKQVLKPSQTLEPLAPTSLGEYDYRSASIQGPPSELKRDPAISFTIPDSSSPYISIPTLLRDRNFNSNGSLGISSPSSLASRIDSPAAGSITAKDSASKANSMTAYGDYQPQIEPNVSRDIRALPESAAFPSSNLAQASVPPTPTTSPAIPAATDPNAQLRKDITDKENYKRDVELYKTQTGYEAGATADRIQAYEDAQKQKQKAESEIQYKKNLESKINQAIYNKDVLSKAGPAIGGAAAGISDALDQSYGTLSPNDLPETSTDTTNKSLVSKPITTVIKDNPDDASERKATNTFLGRNSRGELVPESIPFAADLMDKNSAEKAYSKVFGFKMAELDKLLPKGDLLKSQLRTQALRSGLDNASLERIFDVVTESNTKRDTQNRSDFASNFGKSSSLSKEKGSTERDSWAGPNDVKKDLATNNQTRTGENSEEGSKSASGSTSGVSSGESKRTSSTDNRMALASLKSNMERSIAETILKRSDEIRKQVDEKFDPELAKYKQRYIELPSSADSETKRSTWIKDLTQAGNSYPKLAIQASDPALAPVIQQFSKRFDTTKANLREGLGDINIKQGLFNQGDERVGESRKVNEMSNPKISRILDGKIDNSIVSSLLSGTSSADMQYESQRDIYKAESKMDTKVFGPPPDPNDRAAVAKYQADIQGYATSTEFGQAVMAAKVLEAHNDIMQTLTEPSKVPADSQDPRKRTLVPFSRYLDQLYSEVSRDPTGNAVRGAVGMELALRIPAYKLELDKLQAAKDYVFKDKNAEALGYMVKYLADPVNGRYYQQQINNFAPEKIKGVRPYTAPSKNPAFKGGPNPLFKGGPAIQKDFRYND